MEAVVGRYVWSKAGRDEGRLFIILAILDDSHVLVADGDLRPVERPKKKKLRHLSITEEAAQEISYTVANRKKLQNADLRKAVQRYMDEHSECHKGGEG